MTSVVASAIIDKAIFIYFPSFQSKRLDWLFLTGANLFCSFHTEIKILTGKTASPAMADFTEMEKEDSPK